MAFESIIQCRPVTPSRVAKFDRNDWPDWIRIGGQVPSEWVANMRRNMQEKRTSDDFRFKYCILGVGAEVLNTS